MELELSKETDQIPNKSTFVNVLAWIFIVLGGFATFISILQNIMIHMFFPKKEMSQAMEQAEHFEQFPPVAGFLLNNSDMFFLFFLLVSATSLVSAIGLLKRKNWARIVFIVLMSVGIAWNIVGLIMQFTFFSDMLEMSGGAAPPPEFQNMMKIMKFASVIMVVGFSALFGFVIKKLYSHNIKKEFA